jgi:hypothetical protein
MSHRALVAIPTSSNDPTYDVYKSRNGAAHFKLHPVLESLSDQDPEPLQRIPHQTPRGFDVEPDTENFDGKVEHPRPDEPIVQKEPIHTSVTIEELIQDTNYILYDALYVVKSSKVTTYFLSWAGVMMHSTLAANGVLEVYPPVEDTTEMQGLEPYYRISGDAFLDLSEASKLRQDAPPINYVEQVLAESHMGIFRNINHLIASDNPNNSPSITVAELTFVYKPKDRVDYTILKINAQFGVCIKADIKDVPPDLVWADFDERANALRWNHMKERNTHILGKSEPEQDKALQRAASDFEDKNRIEFGAVRANLP